MENEDKNEEVTFKSLGIVEVLCDACERLGWKTPSKIQKEAIPPALQGKDVIALAETGSGKTGAFALPILQDLLDKQSSLFSLILTPTRELAVQICDQFQSLGSIIKLKCVVIIGGVDMMTQGIMLAKKPHIVIATPGRLLDHLENTKGFNLHRLQYLVLDEADRILNMDFEIEVNKILKLIPRNRKTFLFSATMTKKVAKLQRVSLRDPIKIEVSSKYQTSEKLIQYHLFIPAKYKDLYLIHLLKSSSGKSTIIFCDTCHKTHLVSMVTRVLGFQSVALHGQMTQHKRLSNLEKFRDKEKNILVATDVASRGLDIPHVDIVINLEMPQHNKDYIHRVGRTARAGKSGKAYTFVTQYDVEQYLKIEELLGYKIDRYEADEKEVMSLEEDVYEAIRVAKMQIAEKAKLQKEKKLNFFVKNKNNNNNNNNNNNEDDDGDDDDDGENAKGYRRKIKRKRK